VVIPESHPLTDLIAAFLTDLANADRSVLTQRAYATELRRRAVFHAGAITTITPGILRSFLAQHRHLKPASRARPADLGPTQRCTPAQGIRRQVLRRHTREDMSEQATSGCWNN
jgi:hypothetical protein